MTSTVALQPRKKMLLFHCFKITTVFGRMMNNNLIQQDVSFTCLDVYFEVLWGIWQEVALVSRCSWFPIRGHCFCALSVDVGRLSACVHVYCREMAASFIVVVCTVFIFNGRIISAYFHFLLCLS